jgi:pyruvate/2-oxoglutarate dehydrogenase complex dihydrolipoamide acyltransferase (E2) component
VSTGTGRAACAVPIIVPQVGEAIAEATLVRWHKAAGDAVRRGDVLFELDLDKVTIDIEAFDDGTLGEILVAEDMPVVPFQQVATLIVDEARPGRTATA